jgi:proteasome lid subunit RPN8/RPN11
MARDLNRIMEDIKNSREVFVTDDGRIEEASEAERNAASEEATTGTPKPRTRLKPEVFGADAKIVTVHATVIEAMHAEGARHPGETGGILVGPKPRLVTGFIPSGPAARRTTASYELDVEHLQPLLEVAEDRGLRFLGIWHSHPEGYAELSGQDRAAARSILRDPEWRVDELLLPLSVRTGMSFETTFFVAEGPSATISRTHVVIASAALSSLTTSEASPPFTAPSAVSPSQTGATPKGPWAVEGSFLDTPFGQARLQDDRQELASSGWKVTVRHGADIALVAEAAGLTIFFLLPREYPFGPPDLLRSVDGYLMDVPYAEVPELARWNSRRSLATVAAEVKALPKKQGPSRIRLPRVRSLLRSIAKGGMRAVLSF